MFINCPFDTAYGALLDAIVFTVHDCGFVARCALEVQDTGRNRLDRLMTLMSNCKYGIHDISRTELDHGLPRFNMPLELGLFLGAKKFGTRKQRAKVCLVLDHTRYRYRRFCSDIAGLDPAEHRSRPRRAIIAVRNWLRTHSRSQIPGGERMAVRFAAFRRALPVLCRAAKLKPKALIFRDYTALVVLWLRANP